MSGADSDLAREVARRRTFAIISHPRPSTARLVETARVKNAEKMPIFIEIHASSV